jgi:hypothetical protein
MSPEGEEVHRTKDGPIARSSCGTMPHIPIHGSRSVWTPRVSRHGEQETNRERMGSYVLMHGHVGDADRILDTYSRDSFLMAIQDLCICKVRHPEFSLTGEIS